MSILLSDEELRAMQGVSYFLRTLYVFAIRRYMDYQTGIVGIKRRISYQSLSEEMFIEPQSGVSKNETGSPSKQQLRRALKSLERIGLLEQIKNKDHLIFRCVLAIRDQSVQSQVGTRPTHHLGTEADTAREDETLYLERVSELVTMQEVTQVGIPKMAQVVTPPVSGKDKEKELSLRDSSKKKKRSQLPDDFCVTSHHEELAKKNDWPDPHNEIEAFRDYHLSRATIFADWDRAFHTWLRNAKRFKERTHGKQQSQQPTNSHNRAIENILNSARRSR